MRHFGPKNLCKSQRVLRTHKSLVWVPDLEIVNRVPSEWTDGRTASKARIFYTGRRGSPEKKFSNEITHHYERNKSLTPFRQSDADEIRQIENILRSAYK